MTTYYEGKHSAEFILSEANGQLSRENVTLKAAQTVDVGDILFGDAAAGFENIAVGSVITGKGLVIALYKTITEADTAKISVIARDAEVNIHSLGRPEGQPDPEFTALVNALGVQGIRAR